MKTGFDDDYNSLNKKDELNNQINELQSTKQKTVLENAKTKKNLSQEFIYPTEIITLPSKGLVYPEDHPLRSGQIEIKQMTTKEEEILSSPNLVQKGIAIDKLLQELIVTEFDFGDLLLGDKNAIMLAARILAYGKDYETRVTCPVCNENQVEIFDLLMFDEKEVEESQLNSKNEYEFILPSGINIKFKLLTQRDERQIEDELRFYKQLQAKSKVKDAVQKDLSIRLKSVIIEVNDNRDKNYIKSFAEKMSSRDSLALRKRIKELNPGIDLTYAFECISCGTQSLINVPITVHFFWPDARV